MSTDKKLILYSDSAKAYLMFLHIEFGMLPVTILKLLVFKWSTETLRHAYEKLVKEGYLIQKKAVNLKITYASRDGFNAYNEHLIKQNDTPYPDWPNPEYDARKAESLALQNEVAIFFYKLEQSSQYKTTYIQRTWEHKNLVNKSLRLDDKFRYSKYKGIIECNSDRGKSGAVVYHFGSSNRNESDAAIENVQSHIRSTRDCCDGKVVPLIIFGYNDSVPISIVDYSIKLSGKSAAERAGMKNNIHFRLSHKFDNNYATYYFPFSLDSLLIMLQWSNHLDWYRNCENINNAWCAQKGTNAPAVIDCDLSNIQALAAFTQRPLNILLHDYQVNIVNTILGEADDSENIFLNPISPDEFDGLMKAITVGQPLQIPNHMRPLEPTPLEQKKKQSKPPKKRQWKDNKPRTAGFES